MESRLGTYISLTYICLGDPAESDSAAILDDRVAGTAQIDVHVDAAMHPELSTGYDDGAVFHAGDVGWSVDLTTDEETFFDAIDRETGVWLAVCGWYRHVHHAVSERYDRCRYRGVRGRGWEHDV